MDRHTLVNAHELLWHHFIEQHEKPPKEIVLDFDGTDIPAHGDQPSRFFNRYYDHHCYFPFYVFCGRHLLVSYLRTGNRVMPDTVGPFWRCWCGLCASTGHSTELCSEVTLT